MKLIYFSILLFAFSAMAQTKVKDTITRRAIIKFEQKANSINFTPETPPLIAIAGAPKPSYSYLWEMGDGQYSRVAEPKHTYKSKGEYTARVAIINNYDNGKPPATRPKKVVINEMSNDVYQNVASIEMQNGLQIQKNCDPIPDQEMVVVLSYQNLENYVANGKLYFFYNEKQFKKDNFELVECRIHNGEREVKENALAFNNDIDESNRYLVSENSFNEKKKYHKTFAEEDLDATLTQANKTYKNVKILEFDNADSKETRNLFFTFKTTPEMIKDTSAIVTMRSVFVPNRSFKSHKIKNLEMQIVTSHDPNKMSSNATSMNYRTVRFKNINFKTQFQNNGEGPARMIRLETDTPTMFDKKSLKIVDSYPKCPICPKGEIVNYSCLDTILKEKQIHFTFKNIYVPGSNQKNIKEIDSTKGFVKYTMKLNKNFHKETTRSKTAIFFDKNEPVITNNAKTHFKMGISVGLKTGVNLYSKLENSKSYFVGASVSPYKSYKYYWQVEFLHSLTTFDNAKIVVDDLNFNAFNGQKNLRRTTTSSSNHNINWQIPVLIRYNINNYIGLGAGIQANINLSEKIMQDQKIEIFDGATDTFLQSKSENNSETSSSFTNLKTGVLTEITIGAARIGPSLGARYVINFKENFNYLQLYGIWKF
ncbi:MAG: PKD domain-containing protein [Flavobacterium sp.]|nr:PKD domain-containing protein [Flavobacterium sp.]